MPRRNLFILAGVLALCPSSTPAQTPSLPIPVRIETLMSARVGEAREYWISLPDRYNDSTEKFPVLYISAERQAGQSARVLPASAGDRAGSRCGDGEAEGRGVDCPFMADQHLSTRNPPNP